MEQVAIRSWGNSQGIRIPKNILEKLNLKTSDILDLEIKDDTIVLRKQFINLLKKGLLNTMEKYRFMILIGSSRWGERFYERVLSCKIRSHRIS